MGTPIAGSTDDASLTEGMESSGSKPVSIWADTSGHHPASPIGWRGDAGFYFSFTATAPGRTADPSS